MVSFCIRRTNNSPFVVKEGCRHGVDGIAVGVFPYFPGMIAAFFSFVLLFCRWRAKVGKAMQTPNNFPFHFKNSVLIINKSFMFWAKDMRKLRNGGYVNVSKRRDYSSNLSFF